jgi:hypothetical protein
MQQPPSLLELAFHLAGVDVGDALLDQQHGPIVVRLCALLRCRRHLPNEEHHLTLTAKGHGDLLDGNTVEKEVEIRLFYGFTDFWGDREEAGGW